MQPFIRKVRSMMKRKGERKLIPIISVSGLWLESLGFTIDSKICIEGKERELIIRIVKDEELSEKKL
ncbi:MAG: SymE family type I addiction module toxin [Ruminiclostridium sp.]